MSEPTAKHLEEARDLVRPCPGWTVTVDLIARAIARAEERGQEKEEQTIANLRAFYAEKLDIGDPKACWDDIVSAAEERGFERGKASAPANLWGWSKGSGSSWLLCPRVLRDGLLVVDSRDVRGMIYGGIGSNDYMTVRCLGPSQYSKRVKRKTMKGAWSALSKLMGEPLPPPPSDLKGDV